MMHRTMLGLASAAMAAVLSGCGGGGQRGGDRLGDAGPTAAEPVEILNQVHGENPALSEMAVRLIKTQDQLAALGVESLEGLAVDYGTQDVVILALGEQPTSGYWADITGVQLVGDVLYVQGIAGAPAEDAMTTQQLTYPYAAAVIPETPATRALSDIESVVGSQMDR